MLKVAVTSQNTSCHMALTQTNATLPQDTHKGKATKQKTKTLLFLLLIQQKPHTHKNTLPCKTSTQAPFTKLLEFQCHSILPSTKKTNTINSTKQPACSTLFTTWYLSTDRSNETLDQKLLEQNLPRKNSSSLFETFSCAFLSCKLFAP